MNSRRKSTRREFLKGEAALDALHAVGGGGDESSGGLNGPVDACATDRQARTLLQVGRRAMACQFQIFCDPGRCPGAVNAATEALDLIDALEDQLSVYREHTELMRINQHAAHAAVTIEARLFQLLQQCVTWADESGGAFDVTASPLVKLWGFYTRQGRFPDPAEIKLALENVGSQHLELDPGQLSIRFSKSGVELNLGSVGKGYALDRAAELLDDARVTSYLIHGGQSSIFARGTRRQASAGREPVRWTVALKHPVRPEKRLAVLELQDRGVGTSGSGQQFFYHKGRRYGHVLDPRSGMPAEGVLSATVLAPTAAQADALATMFFVMGIDATAAYCENHPELSVVFVVPGTRQGAVAIETVGSAVPLQILDSDR
jgi:thiamine biosynthesis lipoprotein